MPTSEEAAAASVIATCEAQWEAYKSDCSGFVKAVAAELGLHLTGQANDIVAYVTANWTKATDGKDAAAKAAAGKLVVGGLEAQPNGHVVVVVKGELNRDKYPTAYWGMLGGTGKKNSTINWSWSQTDRDKVTYCYTSIAAATTTTTTTSSGIPARIINLAGGKFA